MGGDDTAERYKAQTSDAQQKRDLSNLGHHRMDQPLQRQDRHYRPQCAGAEGDKTEFDP